MLFPVCAWENNDGSLYRACQVHRSRRQKRQRFPEASRSLQAHGEDFWRVTVKNIFWTQGRYDIVIIVGAPDEVSATALNLSLSALGNIRTESLRAFSSAEMMKIVAKML